jgi:hypothetical protein
MTGPEHYKEAERLLNGDPLDQQAAQVHATLALAAATAEPIAQAYSGSEDVRILQAWTAAIS